MVDLYYGILLSNIKEESIGTHTNVGGSKGTMRSHSSKNDRVGSSEGPFFHINIEKLDKSC